MYHNTYRTTEEKTILDLGKEYSKLLFRLVLDNPRGRQGVQFIYLFGSKIRVGALGGKICIFLFGAEAKIRVGHSWCP
jgi:hypothetical protein